MLTEEQMQEEIRLLKEQNEELQQAVTDAGFDSADFDALKKERDEAAAKLAEANATLEATKTESAKTAFLSKRNDAVASLNIPLDHAAVELAFPDDEPMDDATFAARMDSIEKIVAAGLAPVQDPPVDDPEADKWARFGGAGDGGSELRGDEATSILIKNAEAAKKKALRTNNIRDLLPTVYGEIKRVIQGKLPGGTPFYEIKGTGRHVGPGGK